MPELRDDIQFGLRLLRQQPTFAILAILTLALGIGANVTIFSVVDGVLLRPLPYQDPDRLVVLAGERARENLTEKIGISAMDFLDYRTETHSYESLAQISFFSTRSILSGSGEPEYLNFNLVSANYFDTLGVKPLYGRTFRPGEDMVSQSSVCLLSYGWWQRHFGGDPSVVGRKVAINALPYEIVGVLPPSMGFPAETEVFVPISYRSRGNARRGWRAYLGVGRLRPGVTPEQAYSEILGVAQRLVERYPETNQTYRANITRLDYHLLGNIRPTLLLLLGVVGALLLIACGNIANLLLARSMARRRELAVRIALGAGRMRVIRQLLTESLLLAAIGGTIGLALGWGGVALLRASEWNGLPRLAEITFDARTAAFTAALILLTTVLFGLAPALQATSTELSTELKQGGSRGSTEGSGQNRLRSFLVVGEVAMATFLLIGAGLLLESVRRLINVDTGFSAVNVTMAEISLPGRKFRDSAEISPFLERYLERVRALPGVETAAATITPPLSGLYSRAEFSIVGEPPPPVRPTTGNVSVTPGYFETFRIALRQGRVIDARDTADSPRVFVISEPMARRYFGGTDPIGRHLILHSGTTAGDIEGEIVGVVAGIRRNTLTEEPRVEAYMPFVQMPFPILDVVVRSRTPLAQLSSALKRELHAVDPDLPISRIRRMTDLMNEAVSTPRIRGSVTAFFAALALLLASIGIYGVMSYSVTRRTTELGLRMALGAQPGEIVRLVLRQSLILAALGVVLGAAGAAAVGKLLGAMLFEISAWNLQVYTLVAVLLMTVATIATAIPAWRATRIDPAHALRRE